MLALALILRIAILYACPFVVHLRGSVTACGTLWANRGYAEMRLS